MRLIASVGIPENSGPTEWAACSARWFSNVVLSVSEQRFYLGFRICSTSSSTRPPEPRSTPLYLLHLCLTTVRKVWALQALPHLPRLSHSPHLSPLFRDQIKDPKPLEHPGPAWMLPRASSRSCLALSSTLPGAGVVHLAPRTTSRNFRRDR